MNNEQDVQVAPNEPNKRHNRKETLYLIDDVYCKER